MKLVLLIFTILYQPSFSLASELDVSKSDINSIVANRLLKQITGEDGEISFLKGNERHDLISSKMWRPAALDNSLLAGYEIRVSGTNFMPQLSSYDSVDGSFFRSNVLQANIDLVLGNNVIAYFEGIISDGQKSRIDNLLNNSYPELTRKRVKSFFPTYAQDEAFVSCFLNDSGDELRDLGKCLKNSGYFLVQGSRDAYNGSKQIYITKLDDFPVAQEPTFIRFSTTRKFAVGDYINFNLEEEMKEEIERETTNCGYVSSPSLFGLSPAHFISPVALASSKEFEISYEKSYKYKLTGNRYMNAHAVGVILLYNEKAIELAQTMGIYDIQRIDYNNPNNGSVCNNLREFVFNH